MKCFFPVENFHFGTPRTNSSGFEKREAKKKKSSPHFVTFPPSLLQFSFFLLNFHPFSIFPSLFFPYRSAEISRSEVSGGTLPPTLPPVTPLVPPIILYPYKFRLEKGQAGALPLATMHPHEPLLQALGLLTSLKVQRPQR